MIAVGLYHATNRFVKSIVGSSETILWVLLKKDKRFLMSLFGGEEQGVVGQTQMEVFVEFTGFESTKAGDVPKRTGDVAAVFVMAVGGKSDPAFGCGEVLAGGNVFFH
jgi:hypothetical protein